MIMNWKEGLTIIEILIAATVVILIGAGGYVLYTKSTESTPEEDTVPASENTEGTDSGSASINAGSGDSSLQSEEEEEERGVPASSSEVQETNVAVDQGSGPDSEATSGVELEFKTSPLWENVIDNIYTGADSEDDPATEPEPAPEPEPTPSQTATVTYDNAGFSPVVVTINQGEAVLFVNNSNHDMWVGSDSHPTHTGYPEKSAGDCLGSSFDSCINISSGSSWQFVFNSVGTWGYHNHTRAGKTGTVIVK